MIKAGADEKIYPVVKIAALVDALAAEGVAPADALSGVHLARHALSSPSTRVSLNQVLRCCCNAARLARDPSFAFRAGLGFHVTTYGVYGFATLSSTNFRQTMTFWQKYHELATPLVELSFTEEGKRAFWTITPLSLPQVDAQLYRFLVELQYGIFLSLHRDIMGPSFAVQELHVTYGPPDPSHDHQKIFEAPVIFGRPQNRWIYDAAWLDAVPQFGNEVTYSAILEMCNELLEQMQLRVGLPGKVREVLLSNLMRPTSLVEAARKLDMSPRTLRRKLSEHGTSFRKLVDELRMHVAIKYLRDTKLTTEDIASVMGFSDAANFRHAFRRWTGHTPLEYRTS